MNIEELRAYCLSLPGVAEDIKWDEHLCFMVGKKMFFVVNPDHVPIDGSFKTTPEIYAELTSSAEGFSPAPYLARYNWVKFDRLDILGDQEWKRHIDLAYTLVFDKLSAMLKKEIRA